MFTNQQPMSQPKPSC